MLNFKNISPPRADFYSKLQSQITILSKNVLYITYMQDKILKILKTQDTDKGVQTQVDKFYEDDKIDALTEDRT